MVHIEITNFQSIAHISLDLEGFSTIIGRNFIGKSSTLRAINAALTNRQGTDFIRWGEKFCEVHIVMKGYDILWHKESGNNFYVINKERYEKIGKDEPPAPIKEAGFSVIKLGTEKVNLNYAQQFFPLFLVDRQDTKGADLLTSVYGLDVLYKAVELCSKEQRTNKDDLRVRKKDLDFIEKDLEKFEGFEEVIEKGKGLKASAKSIEGEQKSIAKLKQFELDIRRVYTACNRLKGVDTLKISDGSDIAADIKILSQLTSNYNKIKINKKQVEALEGISDIKISDGSGIAEDIEILNQLTSKFSTIKVVKKQVDALKGISNVEIPVQEDLTGMIEELVSLKKLSDRQEILKSSLVKYEGLSEIIVPELDLDVSEIEDLTKKNRSIRELFTSAKELKSQIDILDEKQEAVNKELEAFDGCPLCGK